MKYIQIQTHPDNRPSIFRLQEDSVEWFSHFGNKWVTNPITGIRDKLMAQLRGGSAKYLEQVDVDYLLKGMNHE